jgi:hypothetical protein
MKVSIIFLEAQGFITGMPLLSNKEFVIFVIEGI